MATKAATYRPAVLPGFALAASIARDSTNGVPIVNQILCAVSRIATLAAKVEKDREALRALADKAQKLARRIAAVLADRTPDGEVLASLEGIHTSLFEKHIAKTVVRQAISYLLSVPREVERLSGDLEDALQEFLLVSALDTNVRVQESSRAIGQVRRLHDFEIEKLQVVTSIMSDDGSWTAKWHAARVEGTARLFVVRFFEGTVSDRAEVAVAGAGELYQQATDILSQISTVEKSHPNIAYLYGRETGYSHNRFIVLRTGFYPLSLIDPGIPLNSTWSMVAKLLVSEGISYDNTCLTQNQDAARHLTQFGAVWFPDTHRMGKNIFLDDRGEPTIGLIWDLQSAQTTDIRKVYQCQFEMLSQIFEWAHAGPDQGDGFWSTLSGDPLDPFTQIQHTVGDTCKIRSRYRKIQHSSLASLPLLDRHTQSYLRAAESALECIHPRAESMYWAQRLCHTTGGADRVGTRLYAAYHIRPTLETWDTLFVHCVADDGDHEQHARHAVRIPLENTAKVRQALGIMIVEAETSFELVYIDDPGAKSSSDFQWVPRSKI